MSQMLPTSHQTIMVVDISGSTRPGREPVQGKLRSGVHKVVELALADVGIGPGLYTAEGTGDGMLILFSAKVQKGKLGEELLSRLIAELLRDNDLRMQLRLALHAGDVQETEQGFVGPAINKAFRLLDAPQAKSVLRRRSDALLAIVASEYFYENVIQLDPAAVPEAYRRVSFSIDRQGFAGWLRVMPARRSMTSRLRAVIRSLQSYRAALLRIP